MSDAIVSTQNKIILIKKKFLQVFITVTIY